MAAREPVRQHAPASQVERIAVAIRDELAVSALWLDAIPMLRSVVLMVQFDGRGQARKVIIRPEVEHEISTGLDTG